MDVGVIGLGAMGAGIAGSLLRAGHRVAVWNRSPDKLEPLLDRGAIRAPTVADAFSGDAAISMLADDQAVRDVILQPGVLARAHDRFVHLSCSTLSVQFVQELEHAHAKASVGFLSTPVLGRPQAAEAGELNVLVAGDPAMAELVRPLLHAIGKTVWPLGEAPHKANVVKLAINFTLASAIETMGEAFALARKWDVDPRGVAEVMTGTLFAAPAYRTYSSILLDERFEPAGFKLKLGLKDIREGLKAADEKGVPMPFANVIREAYEEALAQGLGDKDWSMLGALPSRRAGV